MKDSKSSSPLHKDRSGRYVPRVEWDGAQEPSPRCVLAFFASGLIALLIDV